VATDTGDRVAYALAPTGPTAAQVDLGNAGLLRSQDDLHIYSVRTQKEDATAFAVVDIRDSRSGRLVSTVLGQRIHLGRSSGLDVLAVSLSPEGNYLALLHQAGFVTVPAAHQVTKVSPDGGLFQLSVDEVVYRSSIEIVDLVANRSIDVLGVDAPPKTMPGGRIDFGNDSGTLSIFTSDTQGRDSHALVSFDGTRLNLMGQASDGQPGHVIPNSGLPYKDRVRILADDTTLVRLVNSSSVQWIDRRRSTLKATLDLSPEVLPAKSEPSIPLFSADATTLYVVNTWRGDVEKIDLLGESKLATLVLPYQRSVTGVSEPAPSHQGAALSPDGQRLFVRGAGAPGGCWIISTTDMTILANPLSGVTLRALWPTPDGAFVFAAEGDRSRVFVLDVNGVPVTVLSLPAQAAAFADTFLPTSI
jgi:hypothetical protein